MFMLIMALLQRKCPWSTTPNWISEFGSAARPDYALVLPRRARKDNHQPHTLKQVVLAVSYINQGSSFNDPFNRDCAPPYAQKTP